MRKRIYENANESFYNEEDSNGNYGKPGQMKSYDIGYYTIDNVEADAEENGMSVEEYIVYWFNETYPHEFTWEDRKGGYGFNGDTIATDGNIVFKDIYGQLIVDQYAPSVVESRRNKRNSNKALYETIMNKVSKDVKRQLNENESQSINDFNFEDMIDSLCDLYAELVYIHNVKNSKFVSKAQEELDNAINTLDRLQKMWKKHYK